MNKATTSPWKAILTSLLGIVLWYGLDVVPLDTGGGPEGIRLSFFGADFFSMDRAFFLDSGQLSLSWTLGFLFVTACAVIIYCLTDGLFGLRSYSRKIRLGYFGLLTLFLLVDFNPLTALFLGTIPANLTVFALDAGRALTSLCALIAGLGVAGLLSRAPRFLFKPAFIALAGVAALSFAFWMRIDRLDGLAAVSDECSYLKQAEIFLEGKLSEEVFEPKDFFDADQMVNDKAYYSKYPPGTSLCLLPTMISGVPQAGPVCFLALNLCLVGLLARRLFGRDTARLSLLLACASPFFVFMGFSFLSHGPGLAAALGMAWFHSLWLERRNAGYTVLSACCAGMLFLIRPVTALALIVPFFVHGQAAYRGTRASRIASILLLALVLASFAGAFLLYNQAQTGDPLLMPYQKYASLYTPYDRFTTDNAGQGVLNTAFNLSRLNRWLFGFAPSLLPIAAVFLFGAALSWEILFLACFLCLVAAHLFHWFWGTPWYGPLYYYECAGFLVIIAARGILLAGKKLEGAADKLYLAGICIMLFTVPFFFASQAEWISKRVQDIWDPVMNVRAEEPEWESWVIMDDEGAFKARYLGSAPMWMTGGFRIVNGKAGGAEKLEALYPGKKIYRYRNGVLEEAP